MTATNHAITGAVVALAVKQPALAVPVAFIVHFAMDAIPHFGLGYTDPFKRNQDKRFVRVLVLDSSLALIGLIVVPLLLRHTVPAWLVFLCMFACMSPDLIWGWHFYHEVIHKTQRRKAWFSRVHKKIQWSETPAGTIVELTWLATALYIILLNR